MLGCTYKAVGVLEVIWHHAYQDGDPIIGTAEDVEFIVCWDGEPGTCAGALVECGFMEPTETGELAVHDLYDHAPDYVRKRRAREQERRSQSDGDRSLTGQRPKNGSTPAPAPAPAPNTEPSTPDGFDEFWSVYPRKVQKQAALKAWKKAKKVRPPVDAIVAKVVALAATEQWTKDGGQYVPYPATWLNGGGWDDEVPKRAKKVTDPGSSEYWGG